MAVERIAASDRLKRVLQFERARGCQNTAVIGGIDALLRNLLSPVGLMGRKAALASMMAVLLIGGMIMFRANHSSTTTDAGVPRTSPPVGTAVGDLETLGKNEDLYADFDLLDDVVSNNANAGAANVSE